MPESSSDEGDLYYPKKEPKKKTYPPRTRHQPQRTAKEDQPSTSRKHTSDDEVEPKRKQRKKEDQASSSSSGASTTSSSTSSSSSSASSTSTKTPKSKKKRPYDHDATHDDESDHDEARDVPIGAEDGLHDETYGMTEFMRKRVRFSFDLTSFPKPGTRAYINIPDGQPGRCERFFKFGRKDKHGHDCVRCLCCTRARRKAEDEDADDLVEQTVCQWPYVPVEGEENLYEFVMDPFERHGKNCTAKKITWGEVAVRYVMKNALFEYKKFPFGRPIEPFNRARLSIPDIVNQLFEHAEEHDVIMNSPKWWQSSSAWTKARMNYLPMFDFDNLADAYKKTKFGRNERSQWFGEDFIVEAEESTGFLFAMSRYSAEMMLKCTHIICDGTFRAVKSVPKVKQLFTFHGRTESGEVLPLAFFLLPSKSSEMYMRAFEALRKMLREVNGGKEDLGSLKVIMADWEETLDAPAALYFGQLHRAYCAFHYAQSIIRNVGKAGLITAYRDGDEEVRQFVHTVLGAMLVPTKYMNAYCNMMEIMPTHKDPKIAPKLKAFAKYANKQYFRRQDRRYMLNAFDTIKGWPRTSNSAEGFHSGLYEAIRMHGSDLRRLMSLLNEIEFHTHNRLYQLNNEDPPRYRNPIYVELDDRIELVKSQIIPLLDSIKKPKERLEMLARYARYVSRLLGGATHVNLIGPITETLMEALNNDEAQQSSALLKMKKSDAVKDLTEVDINPWSKVENDNCNFLSGDEDSDD